MTPAPMKLALTLALAAGMALASGAANAKHSRKHVVRPAQPAHIACTKYGCYPVASNCRPATQYDWWGNPTGYDAVVCR